MSNTINKISYAVEIQTSYSGVAIPEIGMDSNGKILYITDNVDTTAGYVYDSGSPVTDVYSKDFLVRKGIKTSSQKIDIIAGVFEDDFTPMDELLLKLDSAAVYVNPYSDESQSVSGHEHHKHKSSLNWKIGLLGRIDTSNTANPYGEKPILRA